MQEDLGGELFSLGDLFPSSDCAGKFLNYLPDMDIDVATDFGTVQSNIGQLLDASTEQLWVNAQRDSQGSNSVYKYEGESSPTYHVPRSENHQGDCLTYSSDANGELITMVSRVSSALSLR